MKLTDEHIQSKIKGETYIVLSDARTTLCQLTLENGFTVTGTSACVNEQDFDINIGRKVAFGDAYKEIWRLEAYLMKQKMYENSINAKKALMESKRMMEDAPYGLKKDGTPAKRRGRKPSKRKVKA